MLSICYEFNQININYAGYFRMRLRRRLYGMHAAIFPYKYDSTQQVIKYTKGTIENRAFPSMHGGGAGHLKVRF